ncbi:MAG TPA: hypothetical protein GYA05_01185 [Acholeplasmataceae bacterium]|jgi:hypothetical protein|nr:hypothetical protein [Acholeplasmataceae bacterium]
MKKEIYKRIINSEAWKLAAVIIAALFLITVSIILFDDIAFDNRIFIYALFGTIALTGFLYSFSLTGKEAWMRLSFGVTRKAIYRKYILNSFLSLVVSVFLAAYYMVIYYLVYDHDLLITEVFNFREVVFLPLVYLALSFLGFFLGMCKMNRNIFYTLTGIIVVSLSVVVIYFSITNWMNYLLLAFSIVFGMVNYFFFMKYKL